MTSKLAPACLVIAAIMHVAVFAIAPLGADTLLSTKMALWALFLAWFTSLGSRLAFWISYFGILVTVISMVMWAATPSSIAWEWLITICICYGLAGLILLVGLWNKNPL